MISLPFGGLVCQGGSTIQALTTTPGQLVNWTGVAQAQSGSLGDGDPSIRPDLANNRLLLNGPGPSVGVPNALPYYVYFVWLNLSGFLSAAQNLIATVRKNGVAQLDLSGEVIGVASSGRVCVSFEGILKIFNSDVPGTLATMADTATTGFVGASGAPKTEVPVDVQVSLLASTANLTMEYAQFGALRLA